MLVRFGSQAFLSWMFLCLNVLMSPTQNQWDYLEVLFAAFSTAGIPKAMVSDGGGIFYSNQAMHVYGEVLELLAGTGCVSLPLVRAGVHLTCVENAPEMLARLRHKLAPEQLSAQVHERDLRPLAVDKQFHLILPPFHSFSELVSPTV